MVGRRRPAKVVVGERPPQPLEPQVRPLHQDAEDLVGRRAGLAQEAGVGQPELRRVRVVGVELRLKPRRVRDRP